MELLKEKTAAIIGYNSSQLEQLTGFHDLPLRLIYKTYQVAEVLYKNGYRNFITGMNDGFDLLAAMGVSILKNRLTEIKLISVIPFKGHEQNYTEWDKDTYKEVFKNVDICINITAQNSCTKPDDYILSSCSKIISCYNDHIGITNNVLEEALNNNLQVINIYDYIETASVLNQSTNNK